MKILSKVLVLGIGILYFIFTFLKTIFRDLYIKIFIPKNLAAEYEASNIVKRSVIYSTICCQLEINTEIPEYGNCDDFYDAIINGKFKIAKKIISNGYNINKKDKNKTTILMHLATLNDAKEKIEFLLKNGIDANATDKYGRSALHYALLTQQTENFKFLLENGANINIIDKYKNNLIIYALNISNDYAHPINDIIDVLLSNNIKFTSIDNIQISEVGYAIRQKVDADIIMKLYKYEYGDRVTFKSEINKLSIFMDNIKILVIKFSNITGDMAVSEFTEFNIEGKPQVVSCNYVKDGKISGGVIGIYGYNDIIFSGFGINREDKTIFELDNDTLSEFAISHEADKMYEKDLEFNKYSRKDEKRRNIMNNSFKYYILAFYNYFNFNGKATRPEFWFFNLYNLIIDIVLLVFFYMGILNPYIISIYCMFVFIPKSAIMIRRLRDAGFNIYTSIPYIITNLILLTTGLPILDNKELYMALRSIYWIYLITLIILLCFPSKEKKA